MKKILPIILIISLIAAFAVLPGCSFAGSAMNGSGQIMTQSIEVADFTRVDIRGPFAVELVQADKFGFTISTDDNLISRIQLAREGENLTVSIQAPANFFPTKLGLKISMPRIYGLSLSGEAKAALSGFKSTFNFELYMTEASTLTGYIDSGNDVFNLSGASKVNNLQGSALSLTLTAAEGSKLDMENFIIKGGQLTLKDASEATLNISGRIDVNLEGASKVLYLGNPTFNNTSISGGSYMQHK